MEHESCLQKRKLRKEDESGKETVRGSKRVCGHRQQGLCAGRPEGPGPGGGVMINQGVWASHPHPNPFFFFS